MTVATTAHSRFGLAEVGISAVLAITWGSSFLLIAIAIKYVDPAVVPFGRSLTGAAALALLPSARHLIPVREWPRLILLGLIWMALPFWLFPLAEQTVASSVAGMMNGGLPVVMATVTAVWVSRMPSRQRVIAILLGFIGIVVVALPSIIAETDSGESIADGLGILYLALALLCYALGANIARPLQAKYSPARLFLHVQVAAALWTLPVSIGGIGDSRFAWSALLAIVVLGVMGTGVAFVAFGTLLQRTGITRAMIPTYFTPIVGLVLGVALNDEDLAIISVAGMAIVIVSAWMTSKPDDRDVLIK
jgi:drug/metabolite transporter (DMT)-like permease